MHGTYEWIVSYDEIKHLMSPSFLKTSPSVGRISQRNPLAPLPDRAVKCHAVRLNLFHAAGQPSVSSLPRNSPSIPPSLPRILPPHWVLAQQANECCLTAKGVAPALAAMCRAGQ